MSKEINITVKVIHEQAPTKLRLVQEPYIDPLYIDKDYQRMSKEFLDGAKVREYAGCYDDLMNLLCNEYFESDPRKVNGPRAKDMYIDMWYIVSSYYLMVCHDETFHLTC